MVNKTLIITIIFGFLHQIAFSQKEANVWHFGANAGIDFFSGKPVAVIKSNMNASEGCATQCDKNGRLLFYSDGVRVWDSMHQIMPNGFDLKGNSSSTQSVIIVPKPFSTKRYFLFTIDNVGGSDGVTYSEIDMAKNNNRGDVIISKKNKQLTKSVCEKITCIKHANGIDYWVLVHKFNSDMLFAYRITGYGVIHWPVISKTGLNVSGLYANTLGYMKISPDGRKIAFTNFELDSSVIADFNTSTGKLSKVWTFHHNDAYGLEFSSKSQFLYISELNTKKLFQYNSKAQTRNEFLGSKTTIDSNFSNSLGALQLAPDGRIYISVTGSPYLQAIQYPDSPGMKCQPKKDLVYLNGKTCALGLPNFSPSIFNKKTFSVYRNCLNDTTQFTISNIFDIDSVRWNFGDPLSGKENLSKDITNVRHIYNHTGTYTVSLLYFYKKTIGFTSYKFTVGDPKPFLGNDTAFCNSFSLSLSPQSDYIAYLWNTNQTSKNIVVNESGVYSVMTTDSIGCTGADTLIVKNSVIKASFTVSDSLQCLKDNVFTFINTSSITDDSILSSYWNFGDGSKLSAENPSKEYLQPGKYQITLNIESKNNCKAKTEKYIQVLSNPVAAFTSTAPCFPEGVKFTNQSHIPTGKLTDFKWDFGDQTTSQLANPIKYYNEGMKFNVKLTVTSDNGCMDSILKHRGVWVKEKPKSSFNFSEVTQANNGKRTIQFNNLSSDDATNFNWDFGKGKKSTEKNPALNFIDTGMNIFTLYVANDEGCKDTSEIRTYHKFYFHLPNAFSPDANNINETFGPVSSIFVNYYKMEIFNQWGEKLFETRDLSYGWDGNYMGKPAPQGVYYYDISLIPFNGGQEHYNGSVRLLR